MLLLDSAASQGAIQSVLFDGQGKIKPLMLMMKSEDYLKMFASYGSGIEMDDLLINWLNSIRYWMYCQSGANIACEKPPPCEDVLQLYVLRSNYQAFILQQILLAQQAENDPLQNGWCLDEEGCFVIKWMACNPAQLFISQALELMSCECKKKCGKTCLYASNDLKCTDMCSCNNWTTKGRLMKRMMMRAMIVLMNTVTNLILSTESFPFFDIDAIFLYMIYRSNIFLLFLEFQVF